VLRCRGLSWVLLIALALNLIAAALVLSFERDVPASNIHSYPDALWWAVTTITTVGYGDRFPMSAAGRGVAVVLMVSGIALFGIITASIAAYFVEHKSEQDDVASRLGRILERLDAIESRLRVDEREQRPHGSPGAPHQAPPRARRSPADDPSSRLQAAVQVVALATLTASFSQVHGVRRGRASGWPGRRHPPCRATGSSPRWCHRTTRRWSR
jgi:hypothetical protein